MATNPTYRVGTASVSAGASIVTGAGTLWLAAGIRAGDVFERTGLTVTIASVDSNTQITLVKPWPGTSGSGVYEIRETSDAVRVMAAARQMTEDLASGNLRALSELPGAGNTLAYFTGPGAAATTPLTALARTLLAQGTAQAAREALGLVGYAGAGIRVLGARTAVNLLPPAAEAVLGDAYLVGPAGAVPNLYVWSGVAPWQNAGPISGAPGTPGTPGADGTNGLQLYSDLATGRAAVANGGQFQVGVGGDVVTYRRDSATTQTELARVPSVDSVDARVRLSETPRRDIVYALQDTDGRSTFIGYSDGTWEILLAPSSVGFESVKRTELGRIDIAAGFAFGDRAGISLLSDGRLAGPIGDLAQRTDVERVDTGIVSTKVERQRRFYASTARTAGGDFPGDEVPGCWAPLPDLPAASATARNTTAAPLEFRRAKRVFDGLNYRGTWNPAGAPPMAPNDRPQRGWFWHISATANGFVAGDRLVWLTARTDTDKFEDVNFIIYRADGTPRDEVGHGLPANPSDKDGVIYREVKGGTFYRGVWDPNTGAYPTSANLSAGDCFSVSAAGTFDGVAYAYGDYIVHGPAGWKVDPQRTLITVAAGAALELECPTGQLAEWEARALTAPQVSFPLDVSHFDTISAITVDVAGKKSIWLHDSWTGQTNRLAFWNGDSNNWGPRFEGPLMLFRSDREGTPQDYYAPVVKVPGRYERPMEVFPARHTDTILFIADSLGRFGWPLIGHIGRDDLENRRGVYRPVYTAATQNGGSLNHDYITDILTSYAIGGDPAGMLNGIIFHYLDWGNSSDAQKAQVARALALLRTRTPKYIPIGLFMGRYLTWDGARFQPTQGILQAPHRFAAESYYEDLFGEFFAGGMFVNTRKWLISDSNPLHVGTDWDPVLQMSVADVASVHGLWGFWSSLSPATTNYLALRPMLTQANFQGYILNAADAVSSMDGHYYVARGGGNLAAQTVRYRFGGAWFNVASLDPIHHPFDAPNTADWLVTNPATDTMASTYNLLAFRVTKELAARGWLDPIQGA